MKNLIKLFSLTIVAGFLFASCEGPAGPAGPAGTNGTNGTNGVDANESCKLCHNSDVVDITAIEFEHSLHASGEAFEEGTRSACAPCHSHQGFTYVVKNSTPATFVLNTGTGKYANQYDIGASNAVLPGPISCFTCHSSLHTSYTESDFFPLATTGAVSMTMYGGSKSINFAKTSSNLCAKCHQPRPITKSTTSSDGNIIDYTVLTSAPGSTFTQIAPSYRTGIHYGAQASMAGGVGMGAIEFGTGYTNSQHVTLASCTDCHMATPTFLAGGHSFNVYDEYGATISASSGGPLPYNFNGCNTTNCHSSMSLTNPTFSGAVSDIEGLLEDLAAKINLIGAGHDILEKDATDNQYHGYLDIYDSGSNADGYWKNPAYGSPAFPTLTNAQFGAIINYQLVFRGAGKGVHNYPYIKKLLENTIAAI